MRDLCSIGLWSLKSKTMSLKILTKSVSMLVLFVRLLLDLPGASLFCLVHIKDKTVYDHETQT